MKLIRWMVVVVLGMMLGCVDLVRAEVLPGVDVEPLRTVSVQDNQTLKTLDTFARQQLAAIAGKSSLEGSSALEVVLDMTYRPERWEAKNIVKIKNAILRQEFSDFPGIDAIEKERIVKEGTVSLSFMRRDDVQAFLEKVSGQAAFKSNAVNELQSAAITLARLTNTGLWLPSATIPPAATGDLNWKAARDLMPNIPEYQAVLRDRKDPNAEKVLPGYEGKEAAVKQVLNTQQQFGSAWRAGNVAEVNGFAVALAELMPTVNPAVYPSMAKRKVEVIYNGLAKLTIPGAFVYFISFTLFLTAVYSGASNLRIWGLRFFTLAFIIHTVAIGVRWWLVSKSVGNWFESIPIKNQFESVLFSSWFGAAVGLGLEFWRSKGIWGAASSFVGWLALVAIFTAPFVAGRDIGGEIGMVNGVLMSYWLYIHVTMVTASYALIGMSFMLGCWWLIKYYSAYQTVRRLPQRQLAGETEKIEELSAMAGMSGGSAAMSLRQTLAALVFFPMARTSTASVKAAKVKELPADLQTRSFLQTLDACHLVILQLAFWMLGVGIVLGAVWADESWGRPWGWDPKETFALVTWIVYLAVIHIRLATEDKAYWTAVLAIVGFAVMLFNWVGVNFFLVGLHSYA